MRRAAGAGWSFAAAVGLSFDDELVVGGDEPVDGKPGEQRVAHGRDPLAGVAVRGQDRARALMPFDDEFVEVAGLQARPRPRLHRYGCAAKSSPADELISRLRLDHDDTLHTGRAGHRPEPTARRQGTAGRSYPDEPARRRPRVPVAGPRGSNAEVPAYLPDMIAVCKAAGFDLIVVETPGIAQAHSAVTDVVDLSLYVMTGRARRRVAAGAMEMIASWPPLSAYDLTCRFRYGLTCRCSAS